MSKPFLLAGIRHPCDVARLSQAERVLLAEELRRMIIDTVAENGGHLAPSLGVVELTLALLAVFDPERDRIIWDVGHQSYAWKILTGRADRFASLRREGGLSGFCNPEESPFDHFGVGHSSTSISAAMGMAMARDLTGGKHHVVAVIGDGSLTGGMALEALNHAGAVRRRLIVVLNDNEMAISRNVGALSLFFSRKMSTAWARKVRRKLHERLLTIPGIGQEIAEYVSRVHRSLKTLITPGMLFEALNFEYIGPVDGHDSALLERHLRMAADVDDQPVLLHVLTQKGRGYPPARTDPARFHGIGRFDVASGEAAAPEADAPPSYTQVFSSTLCELAREDQRLVLITAAMATGTGADAFARLFPQRFVDVGICEDHAVTFAAGLAKQGFRPFVAVYSTFLQRAYDQVLHDVCLQNLPVTLCIDRAGIVGEDGATHHGLFDVAYLRHIPNMHCLAPRDEAVLQRALRTGITLNRPLSIRYPRGGATGAPLLPAREIEPLAPGQGEMMREGRQVAVIALGACLYPALAAADALRLDTGRRTTVYDPVWIKPLPQEDLCRLAQTHDALLLVEEHALAGGFSSAVLELLADQGISPAHIRRIGIGDAFVLHGPQSSLRAGAGLDAAGIRKELERLWAEN